MCSIVLQGKIFAPAVFKENSIRRQYVLLCSYTHPLLVAVAVRARKGVHKVTELVVLANETEGEGVAQGHVGARRAVLESRGTRDGVEAVLEVHVLPRGPDAVDHAVVKVEERVVRAGVEVLKLGWTAAEPVATTVHTELVVAEVALHQVLEVLDGVLAEDKVSDVGVGFD